MGNAKGTSIVGVLAFLTGVVVGALGMKAKKENEEPELVGVLVVHHHSDEDPCTDSNCPVHGDGNDDSPLETAGDENGENGEPQGPDGGENITPDTTTLIDSLEGIEVPGDHADLLKIRILGLERAKAVAMWGSKGVNGDQSTTFKRFADLTTEHLVNIKKNSVHVTDDERTIIDSILEDRVASGAADAAVLEV
jgi:hypothetical protein